MEIKHLKLIKAIEDNGNITKAADELFVTSSALSHQLAKLEDQLNCALFLRSKNKWQLTEEGKIIHQLALDTIESIDSTLEKIQDYKDGNAGTIKLSTECYSFYLGLPSFIEEMKIQYPNIEILFQLEATHQPIEKLLNNEIDIALTATKPNKEELIATPIFNDEIFALLHKDHHLSNKPYLEAKDFASEHLIIHSYPLHTVSVYQHFLAPKLVKPDHISAIPLTEVALEMISTNIGITCFPKWALKDFNLSKDILFKPLGSSGFERTHYLVTRKSDTKHRYIESFKARFINKFEA